MKKLIIILALAMVIFGSSEGKDANIIAPEPAPEITIKINVIPAPGIPGVQMIENDVIVSNHKIPSSHDGELTVNLSTTDLVEGLDSLIVKEILQATATSSLIGMTKVGIFIAGSKTILTLPVEIDVTLIGKNATKFISAKLITKPVEKLVVVETPPTELAPLKKHAEKTMAKKEIPVKSTEKSKFFSYVKISNIPKDAKELELSESTFILKLREYDDLMKSLGSYEDFMFKMRQKKITSEPVTRKSKEYVVKKGDNLTSIAKKFDGVEANYLAAWNGVSDPRKLHAGRVLIIPPPRKE